MQLVTYLEGQKRTVLLTEDAVSSKVEAESKVPGHKKACTAQMITLLERLAELGTLNSPDQMCNEGNKIYAVRARCGLRAYGWFSKKYPRAFIISHYKMKKKQKLDKADKDRAVRNMKAYEEPSDDKNPV